VAPAVPLWLVHHAAPYEHPFHPPQSGTAAHSDEIKQIELDSKLVMLKPNGIFVLCKLHTMLYVSSTFLHLKDNKKSLKTQVKVKIGAVIKNV
jgi:hypothetical protein